MIAMSPGFPPKSAISMMKRCLTGSSDCARRVKRKCGPPGRHLLPLHSRAGRVSGVPRLRQGQTHHPQRAGFRTRRLRSPGTACAGHSHWTSFWATIFLLSSTTSMWVAQDTQGSYARMMTSASCHGAPSRARLQVGKFHVVGTRRVYS